MHRVRVIHWKSAEAEPLVAAVRAVGFEAEYEPDPNSSLQARAITSNPPDAIVIDLSRLPSQGREIAVWLRNRKSTRTIPLVFFGGEPAKIETVKAVLPDAAYATERTLGRLIKAACKGRVRNPVIPPSAMERFKAKSAPQKLGIAAGSTVALIDAPRDYAAVLGDIPEGAEFFEDPESVKNITLWFIRDSEAMLAGLRRMRAIAAKTKLWIVWPKATTNRFREGSIRELGIENGLVDYKICSVNEQWSGILFARSKAPDKA
jgi:CheY-like chemotaxis protein